MAPGTSINVQLQVVALNGFSGQVTIAFPGLPAGVTTVPAAPFTMTPGEQNITFTAAASASDGTSTITIQGTSGNLSHSSPLILGVAPPAPVQLNLGTSNLTVRTGGSAGTSVAAIPGEGSTNYTLSYSASGLPSGVTANFAPNNSPPNTTMTVTLSATANAPTSVNVPVVVTATRSLDSAQFTTQFILVVAPPPGSLPGNRTVTVRTDDTPDAGVFDPAHQVFYAALPDLNRVDVLSTLTHQILKQIPVPNPSSLALTPDGSRVLVGTYGQRLFWIDTTSLSAVRTDAIPEDHPADNGFPPFVTPQIAVPTANGTVIIVAGLGFFTAGVLQWDPATGLVKTRTEEGASLDPSDPTLVAPSANGAAILFAGANPPALYVAASDSFVTTSVVSGFLVPAANPAGTQFALIEAALGAPTTVLFLDINLNVVGQTQFPDFQEPQGGVYSPDGRFLYVLTVGQEALISTVDTTTFQIVGQAPAYESFDPFITGGSIDAPFAADPSGLILGGIDHGVVFDDSTDFQNFSMLYNFDALPNVILDTPDEGPVGGSTVTQITTGIFSNLPDVWFGTERATNVSFFNAAGQVQATSPPAANAGSVDLKMFQPNGQLSIIPQGFTYGTVVVPYATIAAPPAGGETADLFGFGFSGDVNNPSVTIRVGAAPAPVTKDILVQAELPTPYPMPLQNLEFTIPPGNPGPADINITTPVGQAMVAHGFRYISSALDFPSADSFTAVIFDNSRNQLYLSAGDHVDVFSLTNGSFTAPIPVPSLGGKKQLAGVALTPDASQLLVANSADDSVAIIDPDNPSSGTAVALMIPGNSGAVVTPSRIAATSLGTAFVGGAGGAGTSGTCPIGTALFELNLSTHQVICRGDASPGGSDYLAASNDGTVAFVSVPNSSGGFLYSWSAANDQWLQNSLQGILGVSSGFVSDAAVAGDGNFFATLPIDPSGLFGDPPYVLDPSNNLRCEAGLLDVSFPGYSNGIRLDNTGALLYVPSGDGIDIFDVHHCDLRERVYLSEQINSSAITPSAIDVVGQQLFFITNKGLTIVKLDAVPLSIGSVTPNSGAAGTAITIRGTGFVAGTAPTFNGTSGTATFVDADTLQATIPASLAAGAVSIALTNPDGSTYSLDDAFTVN